MSCQLLQREQTGLLIIDTQDALVAQVDRACEVVQAISLALRGCQALGIPIVVTEQYPQGLGSTTMALKAILEQDTPIFNKMAFSALQETEIRDHLLASSVRQWILVGMEAHICVLQTAKDLLQAGRHVVVLNDAITSRSIFDFSTAIAELRDCHVRVTSTETALFELLGTARDPAFQTIRQFIR